MKREVKSAVDFLSNILKSSNLANDQQIASFNSTLQMLLTNKFESHWFPDKPCKGSGFRCIRINHNMDPLIRQAGVFSGMDEMRMCSTLPKELTMWVDPKDVSYRIGENGSIGILYDAESENEQQQTQESSQSTHQQSDMDSINKNFQSCKEQLMSVSKENNINQLKQLAAFVYS
ncbi:protein BTG1-like [Pecten maximus]|uniref:protein BTG1-like n=1 Tax=Pecten maximus TaxID=6579 RepID=UPI001459178D|nr:protein BTG1-like [Pecten maximus]